MVEGGQSAIDAADGFRDAHRDDAVLQIGAATDFDFPSVEQRGSTGFDGPGFVAHRIMDDTGEEFIVAPHRDGRGEVRNAIEIVYRPVQGIDNPLAFSGSFSDPLLSEDGVVGMTGQDMILDEALGAAVEF